MGADFLRLSRILDLSAENRVITNIGNAGTDFDTSGGLTLAGDLTVNGNLAINGGTSNVQSTTVQIDDKNIELAHSPNGAVGNNAAVDGGGITLVSSQGNKTFNWVNSTSAWTSSEHLNLASGKSFYVNGVLLSNVTETLTNKTLTSPVLNGTISGTILKDEDNMASNSATHVSSQQSIKAYVDSQVTAQDLDFQGDSGGALAIDLDSETLTIAGGTGITTVGNNNTITTAIDATVTTLTGTQTLTNKTLTSPVLNTGVSGSAVKDEDNMASNSAAHLATQQSIKAYVDTSVAAENELSEMNDVNISSIADNNFLQYDTSSSRWINQTFVDFAKISAPSDPSTEVGRLYLKEVNSANNALAVKLQKASNIVEVELTSPGCICECGSTDGAKDPTYDFQNKKMIIDLYCGHTYEMDIPSVRRLA
jgi:hypothetical protein